MTTFTLPYDPAAVARWREAGRGTSYRRIDITGMDTNLASGWAGTYCGARCILAVRWDGTVEGPACGGPIVRAADGLRCRDCRRRPRYG